jgi:hypothetical protein
MLIEPTFVQDAASATLGLELSFAESSLNGCCRAITPSHNLMVQNGVKHDQVIRRRGARATAPRDLVRGIQRVPGRIKRMVKAPSRRPTA